METAKILRDIIRVICKIFSLALSHLKIIYLDFQLDTNNKGVSGCLATDHPHSPVCFPDWESRDRQSTF